MGQNPVSEAGDRGEDTGQVNKDGCLAPTAETAIKRICLAAMVAPALLRYTFRIQRSGRLDGCFDAGLGGDLTNEYQFSTGRER
jgi:hypothetical protein